MSDLVTLVEYHYWARDRMLEALRPLALAVYAKDLGSSHHSIRGTAVHLYSAEWTWYSRWQGVSPTEHAREDQFPDVASLETAWRALEHDVLQFVRSVTPEDAAGPMEYRSFAGQPARSTVAEMVTHVVNHGSYHRGQITTMLRQSGAAPPKSTDLIGFYRERQRF